MRGGEVAERNSLEVLECSSHSWFGSWVIVAKGTDNDGGKKKTNEL